MREIETTVTYLEMNSEALHHVTPPANVKLMLLRAENISVGFYRYLYGAVGRDCNWHDRKLMAEEELTALIHAEGVEIWVLYAGGQPAGYFELVPRAASTVEIEYFGLVAEFQGRGLGKWFLAEAIRAAWAKRPKRVIVETCTLDGPRALPLYQKMGFTAYDQKSKVMQVAE
jgi:GNAT superfamily N-acetyltransferase